MSRLLYVDVIGGAAGDMLLAALVDAGASEQQVADAVEAVLPSRFLLGTEEVLRAGHRARFLRVRDGSGHGMAGPLPPRPHAALMAAVERAILPDGVRHRARSVIGRLGEAEARVHGVAVSDLVVHELGDDDTLLDAVGVAAALDELDVGRMIVSSVPLGGGSVPGDSAHGEIHLPAAVTLELLKGFSVRGAPDGETVTPTAAAIFAALGEPGPSFPAMTIQAVGYGAGTRDPADRPNVVRVVLGEAASVAQDQAALARPLMVIEANLDDLTPELGADAAQALRSAGALDVWTTPVLMKKGRAGFVLSALCEPEAQARVQQALFESTPTFGVRAHEVQRTELARRTETVPVVDGSVRVKVGLLGHRVITVTPEHDDVADVAARRGVAVREVYDEAVSAARALRLDPSER